LFLLPLPSLDCELPMAGKQTGGRLLRAPKVSSKVELSWSAAAAMNAGLWPAAHAALLTLVIGRDGGGRRRQRQRRSLCDVPADNDKGKCKYWTGVCTHSVPPAESRCEMSSWLATSAVHPCPRARLPHQEDVLAPPVRDHRYQVLDHRIHSCGHPLP